MPSTATRLRIFLITFDIPGATPGDSRYRYVDQFLRRCGTVFKPMKQVRLLVTDENPALVVRGVRARIGAAGNATALRIGKYSSVDCIDPGMQRQIRSLIRSYGR